MVSGLSTFVIPVFGYLFFISRLLTTSSFRAALGGTQGAGVCFAPLQVADTSVPVGGANPCDSVQASVFLRVIECMIYMLASCCNCCRCFHTLSPPIPRAGVAPHSQCHIGLTRATPAPQNPCSSWKPPQKFHAASRQVHRVAQSETPTITLCFYPKELVGAAQYVRN
jgi:hypothetical protein